MATNGLSSQYVKIPKAEYAHLKFLDEEFGKLISYLKEIQDTEESRQDIKAGNGKSLAEVAAELGL